MSWRMRGLCVLSGCMLWGGCVERDAGAWHEEARALVGDGAAQPESADGRCAVCAERRSARFTWSSTRSWRHSTKHRAPEKATVLTDDSSSRMPTWELLMPDWDLPSQLRDATAEAGAPIQTRCAAMSVRRCYARIGHACAALGHVSEHLQSARAAYRAALQLDPALPDVHALARVGASGAGSGAIALHPPLTTQTTRARTRG